MLSANGMKGITGASTVQFFENEKTKFTFDKNVTDYYTKGPPLWQTSEMGSWQHE